MVSLRQLSQLRTLGDAFGNLSRQYFYRKWTDARLPISLIRFVFKRSHKFSNGNIHNQPQISFISLGAFIGWWSPFINYSSVCSLMCFFKSKSVKVQMASLITPGLKVNNGHHYKSYYVFCYCLYTYRVILNLRVFVSNHIN